MLITLPSWYAPPLAAKLGDNIAKEQRKQASNQNTMIDRIIYKLGTYKQVASSQRRIQLDTATLETMNTPMERHRRQQVTKVPNSICLQKFFDLRFQSFGGGDTSKPLHNLALAVQQEFLKIPFDPMKQRG